MLKVIVIEKGGAEKEWFFASDEVFIGRVSNNGIVLPKPNVSKRHAVIQIVDGRIVFNDLKSTNGSYVNGRRITGPKELVAEDRLYIGDYVMQVLQVEPDAAGAAEVQPEPPADEARGATIAMPAFDVASASVPQPDFMEMPPIPGDSVIDQIPAHMQEPEPAVEFEVEIEEQMPPPPVEDSAPAPKPIDMIPEIKPEPPAPAAAAPAPAPAPIPVPVAPAAAVQPVPVPPAAAPQPAPAPAPIPAPVPAAVPAAPAQDPRSTVSGLARRLGYGRQQDGYAALRALADVAGRELFGSIAPEKADFSDIEWQKLSDGVMRLVDRLRRENQIPADVDPIDITQQILFEFAGLGPLEELLANPAVKAIVVSGVESIQVIEDGQSRTLDAVFSNENTFNRVAVKLCSLAGISPAALAEPIVEGRLPDGSTLQIIGSPYVEQGRIIVIERPVARALTADELIATAGVTAETVAVLKAAVESRKNIIVCGPPYTTRCVIANSLAMMVGREWRVLALGGRRDIDISLPNLVSMRRSAVAASNLGAAEIISRVLPDYIVINGVESADAGLLQELGLGGFDGLLISIVASSAEDCLNRLKLMIQFASPGVESASVDALVARIAGMIVVVGFDDQGRTVVTGVYDHDGGRSIGIGSHLVRIDVAGNDVQAPAVEVDVPPTEVVQMP